MTKHDLTKDRYNQSDNKNHDNLDEIIRVVVVDDLLLMLEGIKAIFKDHQNLK